MSTYATLAALAPGRREGPPIFPEARHCDDCGVLLSMYNGGAKCWAHADRVLRHGVRNDYEHGTEAGYKRHLRAHEPACASCRAGNVRAQQDRSDRKSNRPGAARKG